MILFIKWERPDEDWLTMRKRISGYYNVAFIIDQITAKWNHFTRIVLRDFYSPQLMENTDEVFVGSKKVAPSIYLEVPEDPFDAPKSDPTFTTHFSTIDKDKALDLWYKIYILLEDINNNDKEDSLYFKVCHPDSPPPGRGWGRASLRLLSRQA